uniref:Uncharacterized protein n=1 Tax=Acrobeloides nanus TaxID=290746 RepID=A0A914CEB1_9BILA
MPGEKRKKGGSSEGSEEERKEIDWFSEYLTLMKENRDLAVSNKELTMKLELANNELLSSKSMLTARGVIEYFEKQSRSMMPANLRTGSREKKWEWIFNNDNDFHKEIRTRIGHSMNAKDIGNLVAGVFSNDSFTVVPYFSKHRGVEIDTNDYTIDEIHFLRALCATIPCTLNEI